MGELRNRYAEWVALAVEAARAVLGESCIGAVLYGSVARGTPHDGSDIDLLIAARDLPAGRGPRSRIAGRIEEAFLSAAGGAAPDLSVVLRTPEDLRAGFPLLLEIAIDGKTL